MLGFSHAYDGYIAEVFMLTLNSLMESVTVFQVNSTDKEKSSRKKFLVFIWFVYKSSHKIILKINLRNVADFDSYLSRQK